MAKKTTKKTFERPTVSIDEVGTALEQLLKRITDQRDLSMKNLPDGIRFRRDAWISLQEKGMLTASSLMKEQERIYHKESTLSSNERKLVTGLVTRAVKEALEKKLKETPLQPENSCQ